MITIELSTATKPLSEYAKELGEETIILMSQGQPVAALVPLHNGDENLDSLSLNPEFLRIIAQAEEEFEAGKKLSFEEMSRRLNEE